MKQRDKQRVDPLSGAEEPKPTAPLDSVPPGKQPNASNAVIPGTGEVIQDEKGKEAKRVTRT